MFDIITIGDATVDTFLLIDESSPQCSVDIQKQLLCLNYADKIYINHIDQSVGGNATNVAVGMKRMGYSSGIITELGDDINGITIFHELKAQGVNTDGVSIEKNRQTRFSVVLNYKAERTILSHYSQRPYKKPRIPATAWIYFTSLGEGFEKVEQEVLSYKQKHPTTSLAMNPGSYQLHNAMAGVQKFIQYTDILFVNKEEAKKIVGKNVDIPKLCSLLHKHGAKTVVITDGQAGSFASHEKHIWHMPIFPIPPKGKTGAGDAYATGFLAAICAKLDIPTAMQWGTANACHVTQKIGAQQGLQNKKGVQTLIKKYPNIQPVLL